jgi:hypothetical protein
MHVLPEIPNFKTDKQERAFWATHSVEEFAEDLEELDVQIQPTRTEQIALRLHKEDLTTIQKLAKARGSDQHPQLEISREGRVRFSARSCVWPERRSSDIRDPLAAPPKRAPRALAAAAAGGGCHLGGILDLNADFSSLVIVDALHAPSWHSSRAVVASCCECIFLVHLSCQPARAIFARLFCLIQTAMRDSSISSGLRNSSIAQS